MRLLTVEDNLMILKGLKYYLESEGFIVDKATTYKEALDLILFNNYDLILLDISLPDGDGFNLAKEIKENYKIPIIFLTAKDDIDDICNGLLLASDYIIKPFRNRELLARIKKALHLNDIIEFNNLKIDTNKKEIYKNNVEINLTSLEYKLFMSLLDNRNKVLSREFLLDKIERETGNFVNDNTLRVYIKRIREKLNDENIIRTVKGIGYVIDEK